MKSIKKMLLGIASLVIASCAVPFWIAGAAIGAFVFFPFVIIGIFLCIDEAHFYDQARPGDQLVIHGTCDPNGRAGIATGEFWVDDRKIAECILKFIVLPSLKD